MKNKLPRAIICDIDGTIAQMVDRSPFEWHKVGSDTENKNITELVKVIEKAGIRVIFVSGRKEQCRRDTVQWLTRFDLPLNYLFMRKDDDNRADTTVKREIYDENIKGKFDVWFVLDDRTQVVKMWRAIGLTCLQVAPGDF